MPRDEMVVFRDELPKTGFERHYFGMNGDITQLFPTANAPQSDRQKDGVWIDPPILGFINHALA